MWNQLKKIADNRLWLIHLFFFLLFFFIPAYNFYQLRLPALDFGIANQAMFSYAGLNDYPSTLILQREQMPYLSLHFSLWVPLLSPFSYLFGNYTLLLFQSIALVFAGFFLVKISKHFELSNSIQALILLQFYSVWAIYAAIADGFHDNTIAACFVPALFFGFIRFNKPLLFISFFAILISKENMAIWMPALLLSFLLLTKQPRKLLPLFALLIGIDLIYFLIVTQIIMPGLNPTGKFEQIDRFSHLGKSLAEIIFYVFSHPVEMIKMLFFSHIQPDEMENIKHEFWLVFIASGFITVITRPALVFAFLPLLFQKLWNKEVVFWGINYHYGIELAPLLSIALILFLIRFQSNSLKYIFVVLILISTSFTTYAKMQSRFSVWYNAQRENIFSSEFYQSGLTIRKLQSPLGKINMNDAVSCNSGLVPHLANRKNIYLFPRVENNCKILLLKQTADVYPLDQETYQKEIAAMDSAAISNGYYKSWKIEKIAEDEFSYLFQIAH